MKYSTSSLQNLCLIKIIQDLEYYPPELLACLPPTLRRPLLLHIPIVDLCQLENTCVFDGVDANAIWKERFDREIYRYQEFICNDYNVNAGLILRHLRYTLLSPGFLLAEHRGGYLATIIHAIFERARPTGYFRADYYVEEDESDSIQTLGNIDLRKYGLLDHAADIVNYLVAAVRIEAVCVIREPTDENFNNPKGINFKKPYDEYTLGKCDIDHTTYMSVNELFQFVPPCYSKYLNKDNHYRLSEEDALTLLMEKCNYYPEEVCFVPRRYCSIQWHWEQEKVIALVGQILNKTLKVSLDCNFPEKTLKPLQAILSQSNPHLLSITLNGTGKCIFAVASFLAQPNTPFQLKCFSVYGRNMKQNSSSYSNAIGKMLAFQTTISSLEIYSMHLQHWSRSTSPQFVSAIESFIQRPNFENLCVQLANDDLPEDILYKIVQTFLTSPSSHTQCVKLAVRSVSSVPNFDCTCEKFNVPESSVENKSLEISVNPRRNNRQSTRQHIGNPWLLSLQPLKLKKLMLKVYNAETEYLNSGLLLAANNPSLCVQNLDIGVVKFSAEAFQTLLQNTTLRELTIQLEAGSDMNLSDVISALQKQVKIGTLEALTINRCRPLNPPIAPLNVSDIRQFGDTLFSLPQLNQFRFEMDLFGDPRLNFVEFVETLFDCWKQKSKGNRLVKFVLNFVYERSSEQHLQGESQVVREQIQELATEIGVEIRY